MPTGESISSSLYYLLSYRLFLFELLFLLLVNSSWSFFCDSLVRIEPRDSSPVYWVLDVGSWRSVLDFIIFILSHRVDIYIFYIKLWAFCAFFWFYLFLRYALSIASPESLRLNSDTPVNNFSSLLEDFWLLDSWI